MRRNHRAGDGHDLTFAIAQAPKDDKLRFGLTEPLPAQDPITVNFFEWRRLLAATARARGLRAKLGVLLGPP